MPKYQMPDGNTYDFASDDEATVAMEAWDKQFGKSAAMSGLEGIEPPMPTGAGGTGMPSDNSVLGKAKAVGEGIASTLWGMPAAIGGTISGLSEKATGSDRSFEQATADYTNKYASLVQPTTEEGVAVQHAIGKALDPLNAVFPNLSMMKATSLPISGKLSPPKEMLPKAETLADRFTQLKAEKEQSATTPAQTGLPTLPVKDELRIPGTEPGLMPHQEADMGPVQVEKTPLPVLPDQLKPLSEQYPQGVPIGAIEGGVVKDTSPLPQLPPTERGLLSLADEPIKETPAATEGVNFPLRQEVLQQPEIVQAIDAFRGEAAKLQEIVDNAISPAVKEKAQAQLTDLQNNFAEGMRYLGIDNAADAHGLLRPLYESGKETKLPIRKVNRGTFGQSGALSPDIFGPNGEGLDGLNGAISRLTDKIAGFFSTEKPLYRNEDGTPKVLLHGTKSTFPADKIHPMGDLGIHLSDTATGAHVRLNSSLSAIEPNMENRYFAEKSGKLESTTPLREQRIIPYVLKTDKIVKASTDYNNWADVPNVLRNLIKDGIVSDKDGMAIFNTLKNAIGVTPAMKMQILRQRLVAKGIDAIEYPNLHEKIDRAGKIPNSIVVLNKEALSPLLGELEKRNAVEPLGGPGKKGFSQGGAIGFKSPDSFEQFKTKLEKELGKSLESPEDLAIAKQMYGENYTPKNATAVALSKNKGFGEAIDKYQTVDVDKPIADHVADIINSKDIPENELPKGSALLSSGRLQAWMMNNPVINKMVGYTVAMKDKYRIQSENSLFGNDGVLTQLRGLETIKGVADAQKVLEGRIANQKRALAGEPLAESNLSPKQMETASALDRMFKDYATQINQRLEQLGRKPIKQLESYFPSFFTGEFVSFMYERGEDGGKGRLITMVAENNKFAANKAKAYLEEKYGDTYIIDDVVHRSKISSNTFRKNANIGMMFDQLLELYGGEDPIVAKAREALIDLQTKQAFDTMQFKQRFKLKAGIEGPMGDKPWKSASENYFDGKKAIEMYVEAANEWLANNRISEFVRSLEENKVPDSTPNAFKFGKDYTDFATGVKEPYLKFSDDLGNWFASNTGVSSKLPNKFARTYANIMTGFYVGWWSGKALAQNIVQPYMTIIPKFAELVLQGGSKDILSPLLYGTIEGLNVAVGHFIGKEEPLFSANTYKYITDNRVIDPALIEQGKLFDNKHANIVWDAVANKSLGYSEMLSRSVFFHTMYRYLKDSGIEDSKAMDSAKNLTHEYMVNYEPYAKSQVFGNSGILGEIAGRLQTYKTNQFTQFAGYLKDVNTPAKAIPAASFIAMNIATAGALGLIGMDIAEALWEITKKTLGDNLSPELVQWSPKKYLLDNHPNLAVGALSTVSGLGLFGAFAQNLVGDSSIKSVFPVMGGLVDQAQSIPKAFSGSIVDRAKALQSFTPNSVKGKIESHMLTTPEGTIISPNTGKPTYQLSPGEKPYVLGNVASLRKSETSLRNVEHQQMDKDISTIKKGLEDKAIKLMADRAIRNVKPDLTEIAKKYEQFGDVSTLVKKIVEEGKAIGYGDPLLVELLSNSGQINMGNRLQKQDAAKQRNMLQERFGTK